MKPEPAIEFIITNRTQRFAVTVNIFDTRRQMLKHLYPDEKVKTAEAFCCGHREHLPPGMHAAVYFNRADLCEETVAHEMVHAALCVLARKGVRSIECNAEFSVAHEERFARAVDSLVAGFRDGYAKHV